VTRAPSARGQLPIESGAPGALPDLAALEDQALSSRPGLAAADARVLLREQALRLEHGKRWPWFRFSAAPRYRYLDTTTYPNDFSVGVQLTLPIFDRNDGPIEAAGWARARRATERPARPAVRIDDERNNLMKQIAISLSLSLGALLAACSGNTNSNSDGGNAPSGDVVVNELYPHGASATDPKLIAD